MHVSPSCIFINITYIYLIIITQRRLERLQLLRVTNIIWVWKPGPLLLVRLLARKPTIFSILLYSMFLGVNTFGKISFLPLEFFCSGAFCITGFVEKTLYVIVVSNWHPSLIFPVSVSSLQLCS